MQEYVVYGESSIPYTIITNKRLKNLTITVSKEKGVVVKNPGFSKTKVQRFVSQKAAWIYEKNTFIKSVISLKELYETRGEVLLLGEKTPLQIKSLDHFYKEKAKEITPPLMEYWAKKMGVTYSKLSFRKTKRRWGSCNSKDEISFTPTIVQLPKPLLEYIIIHELAHIKHKHHKRSFWEYIAYFLPDYKQKDRAIKNYSPSLY